MLPHVQCLSLGCLFPHKLLCLARCYGICLACISGHSVRSYVFNQTDSSDIHKVPEDFVDTGLIIYKCC